MALHVQILIALSCIGTYVPISPRGAQPHAAIRSPQQRTGREGIMRMASILKDCTAAREVGDGGVESFSIQ